MQLADRLDELVDNQERELGPNFPGISAHEEKADGAIIDSYHWFFRVALDAIGIGMRLLSNLNIGCLLSCGGAYRRVRPQLRLDPQRGTGHREGVRSVVFQRGTGLFYQLTCVPRDVYVVATNGEEDAVHVDRETSSRR